MGRFKGRKILGVILFCFVFCAVYGMPANAIRNNLFILLPLSSATRFPEIPAHLIDNHSLEKLPSTNDFSHLQASGNPVTFSNESPYAYIIGDPNKKTNSYTVECPADAGTITGANHICVQDGTTTLESNVPGGVWTSSDNTIAEINPTTGIVIAQSTGAGKKVIITYTIPANGGCQEVYSLFELTVDDISTIDAISKPTDICQGGTTGKLDGIGKIHGGATGGKWSTKAGGVFMPDENTLDATWTPPSNYSGPAKLILSTTGSSCDSTSTSITVIVNPSPTLTGASQSMPICEGSRATINLTGLIENSTSTIDYKINGIVQSAAIGIVANSSGSASFTSEILSADNAGQILQITGITNSTTPACSKEFALNVTLDVNQKSANPTSATASLGTICNGQSTVLTLNGGGGGTAETIKWYSGSCGGTLVGTGNNLSVSPTTTTTYYGRYEDGAPCDYTSSCSQVTITVNQKSANPTSASATSLVICNGQSSSLSLSGGGGGTAETIKWYSGSCGGTLVGTGNNLSVSPTTTTTYYGRYEDGAPCNYSSSCSQVTITVNQKSANPTSASATSLVICNGQSSSLSLSGGGGGTAETIKWYSGSCGGTLVGTGNNLSVSPTVTTTYYGRYEDGAPCNYSSSCSQVTITVNQKSADPISATASLGTICNGQSTVLTLNGGGGGTAETIKWYSGSCGGTLIGTGNNLSVSPTVTTTYYGRYENGAPCNYTSACSQVTVTVNPLPTASISGPTSGCKDGPSPVITFTGSAGTAPYTFTYKLNGGAAVTITSTGNTATLSVPTNATGVFTYSLVSVKDASSTTCSNTANGSVVVTINPLPVPTITGSATSCSGSTGNIYSTESGMTNYLWIVSAGGTITNGQGTNTITVTWSTAGAQAVTVKYKDANSCTASPETIKSILVNQKPTVSITNPDDVCSPSTVDLTVASIKSGSTAGLTYTYWTDALATIALTNPTSAGAGTYWIKGTTPEGCSDVKPVTVKVNTKPTVKITNPEAVCSPATINLSATAITAGSTAGLAYTYWTNAAATNPLPNYTTLGTIGTYTYYIKGANNNGCFDIQPVTVVVNQTPSVTNPRTTNVCSGSGANISLTSDVTGTTFTWTVGTITGTVTGVTSGTEGSGNLINHVLTSSGNGGTVQYLVTPTSPEGCKGAVYTITVTVQTKPSIVLNPIDNFVCQNTISNFTSDAIGLPTPTVQWQKSTDLGVTWTNIAGETSKNLNIAGNNLDQYRVIYTNTCGYATSSVAKLSVDDGGSFINNQPPTTFTACSGGEATLTAKTNSHKNITAQCQYWNGTTWVNFGPLFGPQNGNLTVNYNFSVDPSMADMQFRIYFSGDCGSAISQNSQFIETGIVTTNNTCVNNSVTFSHNGVPNGTWTIKNSSGTIVFTQTNAPGNTLNYTTGTPGLYTATYTYGGCSDTKSFVVFPASPVIPTINNTCNSPLSIAPVANVSGFTAVYAVQSPGGSLSSYGTLAQANALLTNRIGCWTIKATYQLTNAWGATPTNTLSPCAESTTNSIVFPAPPTLISPSNTCASSFTLPSVPSVSGFTTMWSINGSSYSVNPTMPLAPGCYSIKAAYAISSGFNCGTTLADSYLPGCESNVVSAVIFPPAPTAPTVPGCGNLITVTPPASIPAGFGVEYSFDDGASWQSSNVFNTPISASCLSVKVKTRYVSACVGLPTAASTFAACKESPATIRIVDSTPPVTTSTLCNTTLPAVCVNTGNTYVHSGVSWDVNFTDNCAISSITASLSGATTLNNLTTLNNVTFNVGTTTVTWNATDACNPATVCSLTVTVNPLPACSITGANGPLCPLLSGNIYSAPAGMSTYLWTVSGNGTIQGANNQQTVSVTAGAGCYNPFDLTLTVTDINGCSSTCTKTVTVQDNTNPVFVADPPSKSFCVVNILQATFDNQSEPDADIIASYNPLYEPSTDILKDRPDYYVLQANDLDLNALTYFSDNCTAASNLKLHWKITDSANQPIKDLNNNLLNDITGKVSTYISTVSPIVLRGAPGVVVTYTISYWLEDACGKLSSVKTSIITIIPRPIINKN